MGLATGEDYEEITEDTLQGRIIDMQDASLFFVIFSKDEDRLKQIESTLAGYDAPKYQNLVHPIMKGTVCAAKFDVDGQWYRARVERSIHNKEDDGEHLYEVYFMDYGTKNDVSAKNLKKIDTDLTGYPPLAHQCTLAYLRVPKADRTFGPEAAELFKETLWGKTCTIGIYDEDDVQYKVTVNSGKELNVKESINAYLLSEGLATLINPDSLPEDLAEWRDYEQDAKDEQLNIWEIGGGGDVDDSEF
jgi:staphylococcal nuclease domain-containing protein 1